MALNPQKMSFTIGFFMLFANLDIPEFQAARIFIFWIEHDFQNDREALSFDHYEVLERAHLSLLEDIYIWQLRQRMNHLQQIWDRLEQGEPSVERVNQPPSHPHDRRHDIVATFNDLEAQETRRRSWCALHNPVSVPLKRWSSLVHCAFVLQEDAERETFISICNSFWLLVMQIFPVQFSCFPLIRPLMTPWMFIASTCGIFFWIWHGRAR